MMTYNFKAQFAPLIIADKKLSTIRAPRKDWRLPKPGDTLRFYTGMRTKKCFLIGERVCERVRKIELRRSRNMVYCLIDGRAVSDQNAIAKRDGFKYWSQLADFFEITHGLPFTGYLIEWMPHLIEWMPRKALRPDQ